MAWRTRSGVTSNHLWRRIGSKQLSLLYSSRPSPVTDQ